MNDMASSAHPSVTWVDRPRAVLRVTLFFIHLLVWYVIFLVGRIGVKLCRGSSRVWRDYVFTHWARATLRILGIQVILKGAVPPPPAIQVANHLGYLDIIVLAACGPTRFLSKVEVAGWPLIGPIIKSVDTLLIDRSKYRDLDRVSEEIARVYGLGESITFFPEGTSHNGQEILPLRSPLLKIPAEKGLEVFPVGLSYATGSTAYPAYRDVCWWDNVPFFTHLFRCCAIPKIYAYVNFDHQPIHRENRKSFAAELHQAIHTLTRP